jgi:hypothetical protein
MKSGLAIWLIMWAMLPGLPASTNAAPSDVSRINDIYLVFYISHDGHTGHLGLAVDNYYIIVRDVVRNGIAEIEYDTVRNHTLTYFDLWGPPEIRLDQHGQNLTSRYYKLPRTSAEPRITERYFLTKGLPHAYDRPCDGLLRIRTSPEQDMQMITIAESIRQRYPYFNTRSYNCVDYIIHCLNALFDTHIVAKEFIPFTWSSTPNKFYTSIGEYLDVDVIKDAGVNAQKSFVSERIFYSLFYNQNRHHEEHN